MLAILEEDGKGEVKAENEEEDEESNGGKGGGAAGKNSNSAFSKASQVGIYVVMPLISTASLTRQVCMFCPHLCIIEL